MPKNILFSKYDIFHVKNNPQKLFLQQLILNAGYITHYAVK